MENVKRGCVFILQLLQVYLNFFYIKDNQLVLFNIFTFFVLIYVYFYCWPFESFYISNFIFYDTTPI